MTDAAVPSTLVKCLYLFLDLPAIQIDQNQKQKQKQNQDENLANDDRQLFEEKKKAPWTPYDCRSNLQRVFVQLLVKLYSYHYAAEELARMDDLNLLFSAITSPCPIHNIMWRKNAAEILTTISRHGLTEIVVNYIHCKFKNTSLLILPFLTAAADCC